MKQKGTRSQERKDKGSGPQEILENGLRKFLGRSVRILSLQRIPLESRSTHPIDRLKVKLASGEQLPVIFKRYTGNHEAKGSRREVLIYRRLLADGRFGAPRVYASVYDEEHQRYWLFLEDVGDWSLDHADKADWLAAVGWLAEMHGQYWGKEKELRALRCLSLQDTKFYRRLARDSRRNLKLAGNDGALVRFDNLLADYDDLIAKLVRLPQTLVHGDIFPHNLMVQKRHRIRPIDWEGAAIGPAAGDLVRLLDGWGSDKVHYLEHYWKALPKQSCPSQKKEFFAAVQQLEFIDGLWNLGWEVEACRDEEFVEEVLRKMKTLWKKISTNKSHV